MFFDGSAVEGGAAGDFFVGAVLLVQHAAVVVQEFVGGEGAGFDAGAEAVLEVAVLDGLALVGAFDDDAADALSQFTNVAGPGIAGAEFVGNDVQYPGDQLGVFRAGNGAGEVADQFGQFGFVFLDALGQRRDLDAVGTEAVVEVVTEFFFAAEDVDGAVGGGDDAAVEPLRDV